MPLIFLVLFAKKHLCAAYTLHLLETAVLYLLLTHP